MSPDIDKEFIIVEETGKGIRIQFGLNLISDVDSEGGTYHFTNNSLGISAYGDSKDDAIEEFKEVVRTFITYAIESDQLDAILKESGFSKIKQATPYHNIFFKRLVKVGLYSRGEFDYKAKVKARKATGKKTKKRVAT